MSQPVSSYLNRPLHSPTTVVYGYSTIQMDLQEAAIALKLRTQLVDVIHPTATVFPNATRVRISEFIEWRRELAESPTARWRPRVINRPIVRKMLQSNLNDDVEDVDEVLNSVLHEEEERARLAKCLRS